MAEKAMISHNLQQHQNQEKWTKATLRVKVGQATEIPNLENPELAFSEAWKNYLERMPRTVADAETTGLQWRELTWQDFENGIREKHPTRSESKKIAEEGSFKKVVEMECLLAWNVFQNYSFEAQEGLWEAEWQLIRAKMRSMKGAIGTMFGLKTVVSEKGMERRRVVAEQAKVQYQLLKTTTLVTDAVNWRVSDKRLQEEEYSKLGIEEDDAHLKFQREKMKRTLRKCIQKLALLVKPYSPDRPEPTIGFGMMPSGTSALHAITRSYGLEGMPVDEELEDERPQDEPEPMTTEDTADLYYLCDKSTPEQVEQEAEATWDLCSES
jgi:hypothetical protein